MHCEKWLPKHVDTQSQVVSQSITNISFDEFKLSNTRSFSIEFNTWIIIFFASFTYFDMLQDRTIEWEMILHISVKGLIILGRPKVALALFFIVILNMDFSTSKVDAHNTSKTTCLTTPIFLGTKESLQNIQMVVDWLITFFKQPVMRIHNT